MKKFLQKIFDCEFTKSKFRCTKKKFIIPRLTKAKRKTFLAEEEEIRVNYH